MQTTSCVVSNIPNSIVEKMPTNVVIRQFFMHPRVVVMDKGEVKFTSYVDTYGDFEEAVQYVKNTYGYTEEQIKILYHDFSMDWDE